MGTTTFTPGSAAESDLAMEIERTGGKYITTGIESVDRRLAELGSPNPRRLFYKINNHCLDYMISKISFREAASQHLTERYRHEDMRQRYSDPADFAIMTDAPKLGEALFAVAEFLLNPNNIGRVGGLAIWQLRVAAEVGNLKAAIMIWRLEMAKKTLDIPSVARGLVKDAAMARKDIHAMMLFIDYVHHNPRTEPEATTVEYVLARDLWEMTMPGKQVQPTRPHLSVYTQPWKLFYRAANQYLDQLPRGPYAEEARSLYTKALVSGSQEYSDPTASFTLADDPSIKKYSDQWLKLKIQSAMTGNAEACFLVGKYYLEKHGWYPSPKVRPKTPSTVSEQNPLGEIGLDYLELSATVSTPLASNMAMRFLAVALMLREHGRADKGLDMLEFAIEDIKNHAENPDDAEIWIEKLNSFVSSWDDDFSIRAADTLGPPVMERKDPS